MARRLRILRHGAVYHVTTRSYHDELRLTPGPRVNLLVKSTLIRAAQRTGVALYVALILGNHVELLVGDPDERLDDFMEEFLKELSHRLNRLRGVKHSNFPVRYKSTEIGDREAGERAIARILCNAVRARLVYEADDWPGFSTLEAHRRGQSTLASPLPSRRDAEELATRELEQTWRGQMETVEATLGRPPFWPDMTDAQVHARICELVDAEQARLQADIDRSNERVIGPNRILREHWRERPADVAWRADRPSVSSDPRWNEEYEDYFERETRRYRRASKRWRRFGQWGDYPPGSFPPGWVRALPTSRSAGPALPWVRRKATGT